MHGRRWKEGMVELLDQLQLLDPATSANAKGSIEQLDHAEKFQHYATLYIRYYFIIWRCSAPCIIIWYEGAPEESLQTPS